MSIIWFQLLKSVFKFFYWISWICFGLLFAQNINSEDSSGKIQNYLPVYLSDGACYMSIVFYRVFVYLQVFQHSDLLTAESVRMVAMGDLMFFRSHTLTVRSSLPDTTLSPTVNTADVTVLEKTIIFLDKRGRHVTMLICLWCRCFNSTWDINMFLYIHICFGNSRLRWQYSLINTSTTWDYEEYGFIGGAFKSFFRVSVMPYHSRLPHIISANRFLPRYVT